MSASWMAWHLLRSVPITTAVVGDLKLREFETTSTLISLLTATVRYIEMVRYAKPEVARVVVGPVSAGSDLCCRRFPLR